MGNARGGGTEQEQELERNVMIFLMAGTRDEGYDMKENDEDNGGGECTRKRDGAGTGTGGNIRIFWNGYPLGRGDYEYDDKWHTDSVTVVNIKDYEQKIEREHAEVGNA